MFRKKKQKNTRIEKKIIETRKTKKNSENKKKYKKTK